MKALKRAHAHTHRNALAARRPQRGEENEAANERQRGGQVGNEGENTEANTNIVGELFSRDKLESGW